MSLNPFGPAQWIGLGCLAVLILALAVVVRKEDHSRFDTQPSLRDAQAPFVEANTDTTRVTRIRFEGGKVIGGVRTVSIDAGQPIRLRVHSDLADEVRLHGFGVTKQVAAGGSVDLEGIAERRGRFRVHLENAAVRLAQIKVS